jgi:hypothetical protein
MKYGSSVALVWLASGADGRTGVLSSAFKEHGNFQYDVTTPMTNTNRTAQPQLSEQRSPSVAEECCHGCLSSDEHCAA